MEKHRIKRTADNPAITKEMMARMLDSPRWDAPYFAHERLNSLTYPADIGKPIGPAPENPLPAAPAETKAKDAKTDPDCADELDDNWDFLKEFDADFALNADLETLLDSDFLEPGCCDFSESDEDTKPADKPVPQVKKERPVHCKKVIAEMDSDDELLWNLKLAKWTEKQIHARFLAEGRTEYSQKTIGTRFCRMKKTMRDHVDNLLKAGEIDWFSKDDEALKLAISRADEKVRRIQRNLEKYKWDIVSREIKELNPLADYSGEACRDRHYAHMRGSATVPLDLRTDADTKTQALVKMRRCRELKLRMLEQIAR
ncbi:hypothetical protein C8Q69DRAFT_522992 [Paecilomyces variotii]|uniref:DUF7626 domain-containing protein n=1 Tax=Byssochlamys spectabilis TaxID=264951 RepID=A0A443HNY9_BYSSP|nr:hypothetical protein C8Q69DRAFT_522992 [Paecilomyces variotii]KAJ9350288.1 hypothetical protein DTO280E4_8731 [Paecilomyces variotii]RWQ93510.1 hypothetical protein C8Q69DRAFT_522992 [Paecilomyces variotii]